MITQGLLRNAVNKNTYAKYLRQFVEFKRFGSIIGENITLPVSNSNITRFISFLYDKGYPWASIRNYLSSINYFHKINGHPPVCNNPVINYMRQSIQQNSRGTSLLKPISKELLVKIIEGVTNNKNFSTYNKILLKACYMLLYHACLRIGELAISNGNKEHILNRNQVIIKTGKSLKIKFHSFKHSRLAEPSLIVATHSGEYCPVKAMEEYLAIRRQKDSCNALFTNCEGTEIRREEVTDPLQTVISSLGLNKKDYNSHSFRIGRTTDMYTAGVPIRKIKAAGRWKSEAFRKYIRMDTVNLPSI